MPSPVKVIVVGAGSRGETYSDFASIHPDRLQVCLTLFFFKFLSLEVNNKLLMKTCSKHLAIAYAEETEEFL